MDGLADWLVSNWMWIAAALVVATAGYLSGKRWGYKAVVAGGMGIPALGFLLALWALSGGPLGVLFAVLFVILGLAGGLIFAVFAAVGAGRRRRFTYV